jgi:uncharacterized protein with NRDE domain
MVFPSVSGLSSLEYATLHADMCLITFAFEPDADRPLLLAANRDEFHARPARPMAWWAEPGDVLAGRDAQAGGTWLAVARDGRWAAVTNVRDPGAPAGLRSRGELPLGFLESRRSPEDYAREVQDRRADYGPFNLLAGDPTRLWYASCHAEARAIEPGVHALSNGALDAPWPKSTRVAQRLESIDGGEVRADQLLALMHDTDGADDADLPDTGVGVEMERFLSSPFIVSERYGTRCTTIVILGRKSRVIERRFDERGATVGQLDYRW